MGGYQVLTLACSVNHYILTSNSERYGLLVRNLVTPDVGLAMGPGLVTHPAPQRAIRRVITPPWRNAQ